MQRLERGLYASDMGQGHVARILNTLQLRSAKLLTYQATKIMKQVEAEKCYGLDSLI